MRRIDRKELSLNEKNVFFFVYFPILSALFASLLPEGSRHIWSTPMSSQISLEGNNSDHCLCKNRENGGWGD